MCILYKIFWKDFESYFLCYLFSDGAPNYYPNSFSGPVDDQKYKESVFNLSGDVARWNSADEDNFTQPGVFYRKVCQNFLSGLVELQFEIVKMVDVLLLYLIKVKFLGMN